MQAVLQVCFECSVNGIVLFRFGIADSSYLDDLAFLDIDFDGGYSFILECSAYEYQRILVSPVTAYTMVHFVAFFDHFFRCEDGPYEELFGRNVDTEELTFFLLILF